MKIKLFLLPITLTVLTPMVSMVGCGGDTPIPSVHNVKIDPSSDTTDITISTPEITLNQELVIPYEVINQEKELDVDNSWLKFDSTQYPLSNPEFSYSDNKVIIPADKVITYDIAICLKSKDIEEYFFHIDGDKDMIPTIACANPDPTVDYYNTEEIMSIYADEVNQNPQVFAQDAVYVVGRYANFAKTTFPNNVNELDIDLKYSNIKVEGVANKYALLTFAVEGNADVDIDGTGTAAMLNDAVVHLNHFKLDVQHYPYICKSHHTSIYQFQSRWAVEPVFDESEINWSAELSLDGSLQYKNSQTFTYDNQIFQYNSLSQITDEWELLVFKSAFQYTSHLKSCYHMKDFPYPY